MHIIAWYVLPSILIPGLLYGIWGSIQHDGLGRRMNDWPRLIDRELPDSHAKARQDGRFVDGLITGAALDELDDLFK